MNWKSCLNASAFLVAALAGSSASAPPAYSGQWDKLVAATKPKAEAGDLSAERMMGTLYEKPPVNSPATYEKAIFWREKAAGNGDAGDVFMLCNLYFAGGGGAKPDYVAARSCYGKAAALGYAPAFDDLAMMENTGLGGPVDKASAAKWSRLHAATPNADEAAQEIYIKEIQAGT